MSRLDSFVIATQVKAQKNLERLTAKKDGDSQIVVALVLIAVAVGLCIIFRDSIKSIMDNLFVTITTAINNLSSGSTNP